MSLDTLFDLSLAILFGGMIGFERQWNQGMAGLRTNTLVAFGSACFVTIGWHFNSDRVAAQIVSGIGFLGAGVILHEGPTVRGLNTAATLWCAAATGALAGAGFRVEASYAAIGVVLLNLVLRHLQTAINRRAPHPIDVESLYAIEVVCAGESEEEVRQRLSTGRAGTGLELHGLHWETVERDVGDAGARVLADLSSHTRIDAVVAELIAQIGQLPGVTLARWSVASAGAGSAAVSSLNSAPRR
jgi:putative Mg2+ transporter-C (MgtC) family protein